MSVAGASLYTMNNNCGTPINQELVEIRKDRQKRALEHIKRLFAQMREKNDAVFMYDADYHFIDETVLSTIISEGILEVWYSRRTNRYFFNINGEQPYSQRRGDTCEKVAYSETMAVNTANSPTEEKRQGVPIPVRNYSIHLAELLLKVLPEKDYARYFNYDSALPKERVDSKGNHTYRHVL